MNPVSKAVWFIESNYLRPLSLDEVAQAAGVSKYHLIRAFAQVTQGSTVMRYVRARRLTMAARKLAAGDTDILDIALLAGYQSHEAFSRAFVEQFATTPKQIRKVRSTQSIDLIEALPMKDTTTVQLADPLIQTREAFLVAGLSDRFDGQSIQRIPELWQRLLPFIGQVSSQLGSTTYGVCCNADDQGSFDYIAAMEISSLNSLPDAFTALAIEPQRYAVFTHTGHISDLPNTVSAIWTQWLPNTTDWQHVLAPDFERYDERFDPRTGDGSVEIWIPVKPSD